MIKKNIYIYYKYIILSDNDTVLPRQFRSVSNRKCLVYSIDKLSSAVKCLIDVDIRQSLNDFISTLTMAAIS